MHCKTPVNIRGGRAYMKCMCDDERRVINLSTFEDIKWFVRENPYLLITEGVNHAKMET